MMWRRASSGPPAPIAYGTFLLGLALTSLAYLLMLDPAFAQAAGGGGWRSFYCSGGSAYGTLYDSDIPCPTTMGMDNIFTFLICNMERLASNLLGQMYCGIIRDLMPAVVGMLTLATLFFGVGFTIGVIPATARDFQMFLLKVAVVFTFATQSDAIIGTGYALLITGLREGTAIGLSVMFDDDGRFVNGLSVYGYLDAFLKQAMHFATDYVGAKWEGGQNPCQNALFAVMAIMALAFPPVFFIAMLIIFRIAITFLRAIFGYLYSIVGIVFLLTMSPFFLSFYLFKQTRPFFDKWLGYLVSFAMQMVILFAFLGFILSIDVNHISGSLVDIIMPAQENIEATSMRAPWRYCTICEFHVLDKDGNPMPDDQYGTRITEGRLACKDDPPKPISALSQAAPPENAADAKDKMENVQGALIKFAAFGLLSLLVLAYLVEYLLNYAAALANFLAGGMGATYAPQLGGGQTIGQKAAMDMPGGQLLTTFERGFRDGYVDNMGSTGIGAAAKGFEEAAKRLVSGSNDRNPETGEQDPGLVGSFAEFMLNPHRDPYRK